MFLESIVYFCFRCYQSKMCIGAKNKFKAKAKNSELN